MRIVLGVIAALVLKLSVNALNPYDPGVCNAKARGKEVVVKDRHDNDQIVVCLKQDRKFKWKMMNGNSYGNYFDPARDCSDVVDKISDVENGVYWIKTAKSGNPMKAWCDVATDGGGFLLIGVKDTPVTWSIPSKSIFIHPEGKTRWSSAFGDKQVLDFRVQISTSTRFADTKTHWYYRLKPSRKMSSLLLHDQGGCSHNHPGIGDVEFIKDLRSNKVVTRNFQCSRFGGHLTKDLGWGKMNRCFTKPCSKGYAHIVGIRYDSAGSFSYSVISPKSGIRHNSTAFLGCDTGKCCACFGPDSRQDYCAPRCHAINGGTVLMKDANIRVWFWIRSSLPKRVWKKCMEFEETNNAGKLETWHVSSEGGIAKKGKCSYPGDVKLNDGVAIIPNVKSMKNLPKIEGLLSYSSDNRRLYLRGKSQWKTIGTQNEINNVRDNLKNFEKGIRGEIGKMKQDLESSKFSCKQILNNNKNAVNGIYLINTGINQQYKTYCQMSSLPGCSGGGWTLAMKVDGRKNTFQYSSSRWSNKESYNPSGGQSGFDSVETKLPIYWSTSFKEVCVGMKVGGKLRFVSFKYPASSLYSLIADGKYCATSLGRTKWKSLIPTAISSLQRNCNREGFNVNGNGNYVRVRLGIIGNEGTDGCLSADSFIGLGGANTNNNRLCGFHFSSISAGNLATCHADNGNRVYKAMGYILIR